jgi:hypothetical protein
MLSCICVRIGRRFLRTHYTQFGAYPRTRILNKICKTFLGNKAAAQTGTNVKVRVFNNGLLTAVTLDLEGFEAGQFSVTHSYTVSSSNSDNNVQSLCISRSIESVAFVLLEQGPRNLASTPTSARMYLLNQKFSPSRHPST